VSTQSAGKAPAAAVDPTQDRDWDVIVKSRETNDFMRVWAREKENREVAAKSYAEGFAIGRAEARAKRRLDGEIAMINRQPTKKFGPLPPEVVSKLRWSSLREREVWCERLLDAGSLAEVFGP
jgi:hypothetical protein